MRTHIITLVATTITTLMLSGCGTDTVTSVDPVTGKTKTEKVDPNTGKKLDFLSITPTDEGFKFKFERHESGSKLRYKHKSMVNGEESISEIAMHSSKLGTYEYLCKERYNHSTSVVYNCLPIDTTGINSNTLVSLGNKIYTFQKDENVSFFSSALPKKTLSVIRYNTLTDRIEVLK